jgi:hypothetical protein
MKLTKIIVMLLFVLLPFIGFYLGFLYANSFIATSPSVPATILQPADNTPTPSWQTYNDSDFSFSYPISWFKNNQTHTGSGYIVEFVSPDSTFNLTFTSRGNYNQLTGQPFATIDDYVNTPYKLETIIVDGQDGRRTLPRAGSENFNSVVFLGKDGKTIYTLELKSGDTPFNTPAQIVDQGQALFNQILSTFKFTTPTAGSFKIYQVLVSRIDGGKFIDSPDAVQDIEKLFGEKSSVYADNSLDYYNQTSASFFLLSSNNSLVVGKTHTGSRYSLKVEKIVEKLDEYFRNNKYCQQDSDCRVTSGCSFESVNKYQRLANFPYGCGGYDSVEGYTWQEVSTFAQSCPSPEDFDVKFSGHKCIQNLCKAMDVKLICRQ